MKKKKMIIKKIGKIIVSVLTIIFLVASNFPAAIFKRNYAAAQGMLNAAQPYPKRIKYIVSEIRKDADDIYNLNEKLKSLINNCDSGNATAQVKRSGENGVETGDPKAFGEICPNRAEIEKTQMKIKNKIDDLSYLKQLLQKEKESGLDAEIKALKDVGAEEEAEKIEENINKLLGEAGKRERGEIDKIIKPALENVDMAGEKYLPENLKGKLLKDVLIKTTLRAIEVCFEACLGAIGEQKPLNIIFLLNVALNDLEVGNANFNFYLNLPQKIHLNNINRLGDIKIKIPEIIIPLGKYKEPSFTKTITIQPKLNLPPPPEITISCEERPINRGYSCNPEQQKHDYFIDFKWYLENFSWLAENCQEVPGTMVPPDESKIIKQTPSPKPKAAKKVDLKMPKKECFEKEKVNQEIINRCEELFKSSWTRKNYKKIDRISKSYANKTDAFLEGLKTNSLINSDALFCLRLGRNYSLTPPTSDERTRLICPRILTIYRQKVFENYFKKEDSTNSTIKNISENYFFGVYAAYERECVDLFKQEGKPVPDECYLITPEIKKAIYKFYKAHPLVYYPWFYNPCQDKNLFPELWDRIKNRAEGIVLEKLKSECGAIKENQKDFPSEIKLESIKTKEECKKAGYFWREPSSNICVSACRGDKDCLNNCEQKNKGSCQFIPEPCEFIPLFTGEFEKPERDSYNIENGQCNEQTITDNSHIYIEGCPDYRSSSIKEVNLPTIKIPDIHLPTFSLMPFFKIKLPTFIFEDLKIPSIKLCSIANCDFELPSLNLGVDYPYLSIPYIEIPPFPLPTFPELGYDINVDVGMIEFPPLPIIFPSIDLTNLISADITIPQIQLPQPNISLELSGININMGDIDMWLGLILGALGIDIPGGCRGGCIKGGIDFIPLIISFPDYYFYWPAFPPINFCNYLDFCPDLRGIIFEKLGLKKEIQNAINSIIQKQIQSKIAILANIYKNYFQGAVKNYIKGTYRFNEYNDLVIPSGEISIPADKINRVLDTIPSEITIPWNEAGLNNRIPVGSLNQPIPKIPLKRLGFSKKININIPGFQLRSFDINVNTKLYSSFGGSVEHGNNPYPVRQIELNNGEIKNISDSIYSSVEKIIEALE
ncbi:MAG TPA: hypothetical protein ENL27_02515 [Candidatus Parcubacteria bacterium]|nr:hypothetical protein [Candidatus Parcubacteria bacterium]